MFCSAVSRWAVELCEWFIGRLLCFYYHRLLLQVEPWPHSEVRSDYKNVSLWFVRSIRAAQGPYSQNISGFFPSA